MKGQIHTRKVIMNPLVFQQIMSLLKSKSRVELVGIVFGIINESKIEITDFIQMKNLDQSPISFSIDYEVMYQEIQYYERSRKSLVGFFHSHPHRTSPTPSNKDYYFMKNWPYPYLWLIGGGEFPQKLLIFSLINEEIHNFSYTVTDENDSNYEKRPGIDA